jgi:hypothetical protein
MHDAHASNAFQALAQVGDARIQDVPLDEAVRASGANCLRVGIAGATTTVEGPDAAISALGWRGWTEIVTRQLRNGTEGYWMRACMGWCIWDQSDSSDLNAQEAAQMVEMLKREHSQSRSTSIQSLENLLMDDVVLEKKQGVTRTLE